ncbi:HI1450 family dsDNA-mimic protein [Providencia burhodogranariea]|uniref:DsDNA-mimic protein n=1 Tax=Providencia burhodogranariea DSM 19968 TaxID=1141662 RepID=K8X1Z8_9GAMM|nr:HI1450 family dsDNA-mimic protein [Providencia burhodogranariea]EKT63702.1 dsDNA-mimic protein [Providencia burhodogranariea DSM 19968]
MTKPQFTALIDEDEIIEIAYDLFLENAMDNLEPADQVLFALQFEESGAAEIIPLTSHWHSVIQPEFNLNNFSEVIIGLAQSEEDEINDIFARILISRDPTQPFNHILWKR